MRQILLFAALAASLALLSGCALSKAKEDKVEDMPDKAAYHKISAEEAYEMMASQEVVVVDVRTREEYDGGHIENAVLVPNRASGAKCPRRCPTRKPRCWSTAVAAAAARMPHKSCWRWDIRASTTSAASSTGPTSL